MSEIQLIKFKHGIVFKKWTSEIKLEITASERFVCEAAR